MVSFIVYKTDKLVSIYCFFNESNLNQLGLLSRTIVSVYIFAFHVDLSDLDIVISPATGSVRTGVGMPSSWKVGRN